tara:strand:- start:598 stop:744 length:147 start_codon:yes stop_codon:yes gene_type:complete
LKPQYDEWTYPVGGILAMVVFLSLFSAIVQDGKYKPANPVIRQLIDRT